MENEPLRKCDPLSEVKTIFSSSLLQFTTRKRAFAEVHTELPSGYSGVYQIPEHFQLDEQTIGIFLNIRRSMAQTCDLEIGTDLVIMSDALMRTAKKILPLSRTAIVRHPGNGKNYLMVSYLANGGFVPYGALRGDGTPHPHGGTGFALVQQLGRPCSEHGDTQSGYVDLETDAGLGRLEMMQFAYDGNNFMVKERRIVEFDQLFSGWSYYGNALCGCIPDGDDLIGAITMKRRNIASGEAGFVRWRRLDDHWRMIEFVPIGAPGTCEPTMIRDADGSLLFTLRNECLEWFPHVGENIQAAADHQYVEDIRVWRSVDNGISWSLVCHVPKVRCATPLTLGITAGGKAYVVANPYGRYFADGSPAFTGSLRERLWAWPLNNARNGLLTPVVLRDPTAEFGIPPGTGWYIDHPVSSLVRLNDGCLHNLISYRLLSRAEGAGASGPTPFTGAYLEECITSEQL